MIRPRVERRSPSKPALYARKSPVGLLFFSEGDDMPASDFIGNSDVAKVYGTAEAWFAHRLLKRCGYSGMLRGS